MNIKTKINTFLALSLSFHAVSINIEAKTFVLPASEHNLVGESYIVYPQEEDTLLEIGQRYEMGFEELKWANPNVNTWTPGANTPVIIPSQYVLPSAAREGIIINLPEMRAFYFPKKANEVRIYPISAGRMDWKTPLGIHKITAKQSDPAWYPPESIRREHVQDGRGELPKIVPPGEDNPLGRHLLRLDLPGYLLHGTNDPTGIGMRATHGCLRFFPTNIEELYKIVPVGTSVRIINEPVKIGWNGVTLYMEVHPPLEEDNLSTEDIVERANKLLQRYKNDENVELVDWEVIRLAVEQMSGLPVDIGKIHTAM